MKTIKLIDLFIKIANGEDTPNVIKFDNKIFTHNGTGLNTNYYCEETNKILEDCFVLEALNEEVEIIEDKKIDNLKLNDSGLWTGKTDTDLIVDKINEIIDMINGE